MAKALTKCYLLFEKDNIALGISWDKTCSREWVLYGARRLRSQYLLILKKRQS